MKNYLITVAVILFAFEHFISEEFSTMADSFLAVFLCLSYLSRKYSPCESRAK